MLTRIKLLLCRILAHHFALDLDLSGRLHWRCVLCGYSHLVSRDEH